MGFFDRFGAPPKIVRDQWNGYAYRFGEGERCIVSFDVQACDPSEQKPSQLRRLIGFSPDGQVSPSRSTNAASCSALHDPMIVAVTPSRVISSMRGLSAGGEDVRMSCGIAVQGLHS